MTPAAEPQTPSPSVDRDAAYERELAEMRAEEARLLPHFVDGEDSEEGAVRWREDPSDPGIVAAGYHEAPAELVRRAAAAARAAQPQWDAIGAEERARLMRRGVELLDEDELVRIAATISLETGKNRAEAYKEAEELKVLLARYCDIAADPEAMREPLEPDTDPISMSPASGEILADWVTAGEPTRFPWATSYLPPA